MVSSLKRVIGSLGEEEASRNEEVQETPKEGKKKITYVSDFRSHEVMRSDVSDWRCQCDIGKDEVWTLQRCNRSSDVLEEY